MKFELRKTLKEINREFGLTMVLVNHDQNEALTFCVWETSEKPPVFGLI